MGNFDEMKALVREWEKGRPVVGKHYAIAPFEIRALAARLGEIAARLERAEAGHE